MNPLMTLSFNRYGLFAPSVRRIDAVGPTAATSSTQLRTSVPQLKDIPWQAHSQQPAAAILATSNELNKLVLNDLETNVKLIAGRATAGPKPAARTSSPVDLSKAIHEPDGATPSGSAGAAAQRWAAGEPRTGETLVQQEQPDVSAIIIVIVIIHIIAQLAR